MGRSDFLSFFVVLAEISSGVKEFFRKDAGMMRMVSQQKKMGSPAAPAVAGPSFKAFLKWRALQSSIPLGSRTRRFMSSELFE
jgi:hypothetical protein